MDLSWLTSLFGAIGGGVFVIAVAGFFGRSLVDHWLRQKLQDFQSRLDQSLEDTKATLRRAEYLYEFQMEAARDFQQLMKDLEPKRLPGQDHLEAMSDFSAHSLGVVAGRIDDYLNVHEPVLPEKLVKQLKQMAWTATDLWGDVAEGYSDPDYLLDGANYKRVSDLYEGLHTAQRMLRNLIWTAPQSEYFVGAQTKT